MKLSSRTIVAAAALAAMAGTTLAQVTIDAAAPGNARFRFNTGAVPTSPTATAPGASDLNVNVTAGDQMFANWWHYRTGNDTREFAYHHPSGNAAFTAAGDTMTGTFNLPSAAPVFRSDLTYRILDPDGAGTGTALLQSFNKITNTSSTSQTLAIFHYADFDPAGSFSHPYSYDNAEQAITGSSGAFTVWHKGFGASAYQAADFSIIRTALTDTGITNLNNTIDGLPSPGPGSGDLTSAFQWNITLAPGEMVELLAVMSVNTLPVPTPGAVALFGLAGLAGIRRRR